MVADKQTDKLAGGVGAKHSDQYRSYNDCI